VDLLGRRRMTLDETTVIAAPTLKNRAAAVLSVEMSLVVAKRSWKLA
jgi:hypothetical protein